MSAPEFEVYSYGRKAGSAKPEFKMDIEVDAEVFRGNSDDQESWSCCGMNGAIMLEIVCHPQMPIVMDKLVKNILKAQQPDRPLKIGVRCYAGRHRSVAFATMLVDSLLELDPDGGTPAVSYKHMAAEDRPHCGCPDACQNLVPGRNKKVEDIIRRHKHWDVEALRLHWQENGEAAIVVFRRLWATALEREIGILL